MTAYQESHTTNTDTNGFIIVNIGEGITSNDFTAIDWSDDEHFLNVQVDLGSGLVDIGTTQFMTVPYAIHALKANNVSGLETIDEGNGMGYRLIGRDTINYGSIGQEAIDLSFSNSNSQNHGATGNFSLVAGFNSEASGFISSALGSNTLASGSFSTAMGQNTHATGQGATVFGQFSVASGINSTAFGSATAASGPNSTTLGLQTLASGDGALATGYFTEARGINSVTFGNGSIASGIYSTAFGRTTRARSYGEIAMGYYNTDYTPIDSLSPQPEDRLFVIGNGFSLGLGESDALSILKNGTITAPSLDISEITSDKSLVTKEYVDTKTGLEAIDEGNGLGWRLADQNANNFGLIGLDAIDLSFSPLTSSQHGATGTFSVAVGFNSIASGNHSKSLGYYTIAPTLLETAMGSRNTIYTPEGDFNTWNANDRLFVIGNGRPNMSRSNALTILKNGNLGITTATPEVKLQITGGTDAGLNQDGGYIVLGETSGRHMVFDNNEIMVKDGNQPQTLFLNNDGGAVSVGGTVVHSSDRRLKQDIEHLPYGLSEILQLEPKQYYWKNRGVQSYKSLGLIAQDVQPIIKEIVHIANDENKTLSVSYVELIPILINAIQEQNQIIENQSRDLNAYKENYQTLLSRVEQLENIFSNLTSTKK